MTEVGGKSATTAQIAQCVAEQLSSMPPDLARSVRQFLVEPYRTDRVWSYGPETIRCWMVLADPISGTGIAFCPAGVPIDGRKWILLWIENDLDIGMDSSWFDTLELAFLDSHMSED